MDPNKDALYSDHSQERADDVNRSAGDTKGYPPGCSKSALLALEGLQTSNRTQARWWPLPIYLALSVAMTWPLAAQWGERIPADRGNDVWIHEWTFWWLKQALLSGQDPYFTPLLFHPSGVSLTSHNIAWFNFVLWFPLQAAVGGDAAHNLTYLLLFTFNAYALYLFAADQLKAPAAAFVAGLVFGFWPYTLSGAGHPNMLTVGWLPLALLYLSRALTASTLRDSILAGLCLALLGVARWQLLLLAGLVVGLFTLYCVATRPTARTARALRNLLVTGLVMCGLMAPLALPVIRDYLTHPFADDLLIYEPAFSADLASYIIPHGSLLLWSTVVAHLPNRLQFTQQEVGFLGYTVMGLALIGLFSRRREALIWFALTLLLMLLALGPVITVGQQQYPALPTPYRLIEEWFFNRILRRPERYNALLGLPVGMLAALGVAVLHKQFAPVKSRLCILLCTLFILAEYCLIPYPLAATAIPPWYQQLADEPTPFAIVGIPIGSRYADKLYMHYQTHHGKPMVGGHVSRPPRQSITFMFASPFLDDILFRREMNPALVDVTHQLRYLAAANVRYLILHKTLATDEQIQAWQEWLAFEPRHEDDQVVVYVTSPRAGIDFVIDRHLTAEIGLIGAGFSPSQTQQGEIVTIDLQWASQGAADGDYQVCARLSAEDGSVRQTDCYLISPEWPTSRWQANEVARGRHLLRVDPHLPRGKYQLEVGLWEPVTGVQPGEPLALGQLAVNSLPRTFVQPTPAHLADLQLGDSLYLHGYDLSVGETISLTLYWQTARRMERSYKVFVHVVDPSSGVLLSQYDAAPRNWRYPTTWWEAGEVVSETIELRLEHQAVSELILLLGLYDEETGERLPMRGPAGERHKDNAFLIDLRLMSEE